MSGPVRRVLVVNTGSSSLKYQLLQEGPDGRGGALCSVAGGHLPRIGEPGHGQAGHSSGGRQYTDDVDLADHGEAFAALLAAFARHGPDLGADPPLAVGHRVVHGGSVFREPTAVDDDVLAAVRELVPLAPLHNPAALAGIESARRALPGPVQVAVFDTAFHATLDEAATTYAVPRSWYEQYGVRRYGFHGLSHSHVAQRVSALAGRSDLALVSLHLGNGASACAVRDGRSVATSMGLTPTEGLVMGSRSGDLDPGVIGYLCRRAGLTVEEVDHALNHDSGLLGLAGARDFRTVQERAESGDEDSRLALEVTVRRIVAYVGAYATALSRLDAIAFTGGIGEHSAWLRDQVLGRLGLFGVLVDEAANVDGPAERRLTAPSSAVTGYVVPAGEEREIARQCLGLLDGS